MKTYVILNSEGDILKLEIEKYKDGFTTITFCANMNTGAGRIYFPVSAKELREFFNSKITLSEIVQNAKKDRFLLIRYDKGYIADRSFVACSLQCGDILYEDIFDDMKLDNKEITKIITDNQLHIGTVL
jgi:hypothetical protein